MSFVYLCRFHMTFCLRIVSVSTTPVFQAYDNVHVWSPCLSEELGLSVVCGSSPFLASPIYENSHMEDYVDQVFRCHVPYFLVFLGDLETFGLSTFLFLRCLSASSLDLLLRRFGFSSSARCSSSWQVRMAASVSDGSDLQF